MKPVYSLIAVLVMLIAAGVIVMLGNPEEKVGLSGVMEVVGDAQRAVVKPAMVLTRVSPEEEMRLGRRLAGYMHFAQQREHKKEFAETESYVKRLGKRIARGVKRSEIKYEFHLIDGEMINAFALPGGQIFVFSGLVDFAESEAELAMILGHEITHVDARHCIESFQAEMAAEKVASSVLGNDRWLAGFAMRLASRVITGGYRKIQEFEADAFGLQLAVKAGYDPQAAERIMQRLGDRFKEEKNYQKAADPVAELNAAIKSAAGSYFHSHPPTIDRVDRLRRLASQNSGKKRYYVGKENLKIRLTRMQKQITAEFRYTGR